LFSHVFSCVCNLDEFRLLCTKLAALPISQFAGLLVASTTGEPANLEKRMLRRQNVASFFLFTREKIA
jgi:hypothetical protein